MLLVTIVCFLLAGLYFFGLAVRHLWLLEWYQLNPAPIPEAPSDEKTDSGPKLTRLGRPIVEIKLSA
ncbi:MAG: energy-converting hydrogenase Eha subunit F [Candidatus Latescibacterota bacterium]|jgi:energy-converting hydrogenase Eha subunit F